MVEKNKAVIRSLWNALNQGNISAIDEIYSPDVVYHGTGAMTHADREGFKQFIGVILVAFPDMIAEEEELLADGDKVIYRLIFSGTHQGDFWGIPATGNSVRIRSIGIARIADGRIIEEWENVDEFGLMQQLGVIGGQPD